MKYIKRYDRKLALEPFSEIILSRSLLDNVKVMPGWMTNEEDTYPGEKMTS